MTLGQVRCRAGKSELFAPYIWFPGERERESVWGVCVCVYAPISKLWPRVSSVPVGEKLKDPRLSPSHVSPC